MLTERAIPGLHDHLCNTLLDQEGRGLRILDVGCGTGAWLHRLRAAGFSRLTGIDLDPPPAEAEITYFRFDLDHDDVKTLGQFDLITCIEVIEHLENVGNLLDLVKASLRPGGRLILTTPNVESLRARVRSLLKGKLPSFDERSDPTHLFPILRDTLEKLFARRALTIAEVRQYPDHARDTLQFRPAIDWTARLFRPFLGDPLFGDNVVYVVMHAH